MLSKIWKKKIIINKVETIACPKELGLIMKVENLIILNL